MTRKRNGKTNRPTDPGAAYYLRGIPPDLWALVVEKAKGEGRNIRWVILQALRDWLDGVYEPAHKETHAPGVRLQRR